MFPKRISGYTFIKNTNTRIFESHGCIRTETVVELYITLYIYSKTENAYHIKSSPLPLPSISMTFKMSQQCVLLSN